jgi:hypothetical protein
VFKLKGAGSKHFFTYGICRRFEGKIALNRFVIEGGEISVGDEVQLVRGRACTESVESTEN